MSSKFEPEIFLSSQKLAAVSKGIQSPGHGARKTFIQHPVWPMTSREGGLRPRLVDSRTEFPRTPAQSPPHGGRGPCADALAGFRARKSAVRGEKGVRSLCLPATIPRTDFPRPHAGRQASVRARCGGLCGASQPATFFRSLNTAAFLARSSFLRGARCAVQESTCTSLGLDRRED